MIPLAVGHGQFMVRKPRASGDDPNGKLTAYQPVM